MAGLVLPLISSAIRSPWFKATRDLTTAYGDHEGRLTPVTFNRTISDEYRVLRTAAGGLGLWRLAWGVVLRCNAEQLFQLRRALRSLRTLHRKSRYSDSA